jgi:hypothetical protein
MLPMDRRGRQCGKRARSRAPPKQHFEEKWRSVPAFFVSDRQQFEHFPAFGGALRRVVSRIAGL